MRQQDVQGSVLTELERPISDSSTVSVPTVIQTHLVTWRHGVHSSPVFCVEWLFAWQSFQFSIRLNLATGRVPLACNENLRAIPRGTNTKFSLSSVCNAVFVETAILS